MKTRKELMKILKKEKKRMKRIREFLIKHEGQYFTGDDLADELGILCSGRLLNKMEGLKDGKYKKWSSFDRYQYGIEEIEIPEKPDDRYCSTIYYYGYRNDLPKDKRKA